MAETLQAPQSCADADEWPRWYACYTRARHEKRAYAGLLDRGFEAYLPLAPRVSQWKDRKKLVEWPLFPSYVFCRLAAAELHEVLAVPGIATLVKSDGRAVAIPDEELENVRRFTRAVASGLVEAETSPYFAEGEWVEVVTGPLEGVRGVVVGHRGRCRLLIGLRAIGQGLEVIVNVNVLKSLAPRCRK
jgi:transcription antitermination factor NusG